MNEEIKKKDIYAPVVVFAYNRADKIVKCLESLEKNQEASQTELIIYSDAARNEKDQEAVRNTRKVLKDYKKKARFLSVSVIEAGYNKGLSASIIEGVTGVLSRYKKAIIIEDDLIVSENFLSFMNGALNFYRDNIKIGAISGYTYPLKELERYKNDVYVLRKGDCWGWATWADRWNGALWAEIDFRTYFADKGLRKKFENTENGWDLLMLLQSKGKISSWAIRWVLNLLKEDLWTIYPKSSYVTNTGFDGSGTHSSKSERNHFFTGLKKQGMPNFKNMRPDIELEKAAAIYPRKGFMRSVKYFFGRCYVRIYDLKRFMQG